MVSVSVGVRFGLGLRLALLVFALGPSTPGYLPPSLPQRSNNVDFSVSVLIYISVRFRVRDRVR